MSERVKFSRAVAMDVFLELGKLFDPRPEWHRPHALCERLCAVGGFRRGKAEMKDLEILYIPRRQKVKDAGDMFGVECEVDLAERLIEELRLVGVVVPRLKDDGTNSSWGSWNKHAVHVGTGLPLDLFAATPENYFNRLVVTTGPVELNVRIAGLARKMSWEWEVNSPGFVPLGGTWETCPRERRTMRSEREVFEFVGLDYLRPEERR